MIVGSVESIESLVMQIAVMKYDVLASADIFGGVSVVLDEKTSTINIKETSINIIGEL